MWLSSVGGTCLVLLLLLDSDFVSTEILPHFCPFYMCIRTNYELRTSIGANLLSFSTVPKNENNSTTS